MIFYDNNRPDSHVENHIKQNDTPFNIIELPKVEEEYFNCEDKFASEQYKNLIDKLKSKSKSGNVDLGHGLSPEYSMFSFLMSTFLSKYKKIEIEHKEKLEELTVKIITDYFKIPSDVLQFDFKLENNPISISNTPSSGSIKEQVEDIEEKKQYDPEIFLNERRKRRIINSLTQGSSVDLTYLFENYKEEIIDIIGDEYVCDNYFNIVTSLMLGYWHVPEIFLDGAMGINGQGAAAGEAEIDTKTDPPTIKARSVSFPFLIHESVKAVMEYLGKEKEPKDVEMYIDVLESEDQIVHEVWDIRYGPVIWRKFFNMLPESVKNGDKREYLPYIYTTLINNITTEEFLFVINEIIKETDESKKLLSALYYDMTMFKDGEQTIYENTNFKKQLQLIYEK